MRAQIALAWSTFISLLMASVAVYVQPLMGLVMVGPTCLVLVLWTRGVRRAAVARSGERFRALLMWLLGVWVVVDVLAVSKTPNPIWSRQFWYDLRWNDHPIETALLHIMAVGTVASALSFAGFCAVMTVSRRRRE